MKRFSDYLWSAAFLAVSLHSVHAALGEGTKKAIIEKTTARNPPLLWESDLEPLRTHATPEEVQDVLQRSQKTFQAKKEENRAKIERLNQEIPVQQARSDEAHEEMRNPPKRTWVQWATGQDPHQIARTKYRNESLKKSKLETALWKASKEKKGLDDVEANVLPGKLEQIEGILQEKAPQAAHHEVTG